ncbi:MAG TPA: hypothetical protein VLZ07_10900, partial [Syntrophales bacterium]|nr:hypothetical protein [Syntrophales bacterium]
LALFLNATRYKLRIVHSDSKITSLITGPLVPSPPARCLNKAELARGNLRHLIVTIACRRWY